MRGCIFCRTAFAAAECAFIANFARNSLRGGNARSDKFCILSICSAKRAPAKRYSCCWLNYISRISNAATGSSSMYRGRIGDELHGCAVSLGINFLLATPNNWLLTASSYFEYYLIISRTLPRYRARQLVQRTRESLLLSIRWTKTIRNELSRSCSDS